MARSTRDTTEIYRSVVKYKAPWTQSGEATAIYGPYDGPEGKGHAKRRIKDQHGDVIEAKVQRLEAVPYSVYDADSEESEERATLTWVDVDE